MESFQPFFELNRIQHEINRLFESLPEVRGGQDTPSAAWIPSVDMYEASNELVINFELPGVDVQSIQLSVYGGSLTVKGNKPRMDPPAGAQFHCLERGSGTFKREVRLATPINTHQARAAYRDGLLRVTFPKVPNRRGERVTIPIEEHK